MTERVGSWNAVSNRRVDVAGHVDPPVGRHALDHEAGLTPIFTSLRRGGPRRHAGTRALRPVVDPVEQFRRDPQTAPIPVVPPIDPYVPASFVEPSPPPSPTETTMCWSPGASPVDAWGAGWTAHDPGYDAGYPDTGYDVAGHGSGGYDVGYETGYDTGYDAGHDGYGPAGYDPGYAPAQYPTPQYAPDPYAYLRQDPSAYDPLTDSGRHHLRLAPAGW